jgi:hypothetical protein
MPIVRFEPTFPSAERQQTYALDHAATVIGYCITEGTYFIKNIGYYRVGLQCLLSHATHVLCTQRSKRKSARKK